MVDKLTLFNKCTQYDKGEMDEFISKELLNDHYDSLHILYNTLKHLCRISNVEVEMRDIMPSVENGLSLHINRIFVDDTIEISLHKKRYSVKCAATSTGTKIHLLNEV